MSAGLPAWPQEWTCLLNHCLRISVEQYDLFVSKFHKPVHRVKTTFVCDDIHALNMITYTTVAYIENVAHDHECHVNSVQQ